MVVESALTPSTCSNSSVRDTCNSACSVEVLKGKIKHTGELEFLPGPAVKAQATETDPSAQGLLDDGEMGK